MFEDTETYRLARFSSAWDAETARRCLTDAGIDSAIVPESGDSPDADEPVHLVCRSVDRIQAIVVLERARVI